MAERIVPIFCPYGAGGVTAYFVAASRPTLVDTGGARHPHDQIRRALRARGTDLGAVRVVVNTHGHWDHAGGNAKVVAAAGEGVEVLIHERGAAYLGDLERHLTGYATATERLLEEPGLLAAQREVFPATFEPGPEATRLLREGDQIDLGDGIVFDVLETPGHAVDHVALYWAREGVLIAGDAAQGTGSRVGSGPLYFGSVDEARESIGRLRAVPFRTLHVSHPFGRLGTEERVRTYDGAGGRAFLDESLAALDMMEEAVGGAVRDAPEAGFQEIARRATERLVRAGRWALRPSSTTGVAVNTAPTMHHFWRAARGIGPA